MVGDEQPDNGHQRTGHTETPSPSARTAVRPSGRITFVFTDIEGSTKLLKQFPEVARQMFDRHDELLRTVWSEHSGYEVSTEGDSFFVAFSDPDDALAACGSAQRLLNDEPWPIDAGLRVRMGMHVGAALERGNNYFGLAIHQAARISAAANGGQVLVTDAVARGSSEISRGRLSRLGRFRVRDFDEPEVLFRLDIDGVDVDERPIRARPEEGHNLVRQPTSFLGRGTDVAKLSLLLERGRTVSLVGSGGVGKTRLAMETAFTVVPNWADGVWFVDLADLADSALVIETVAATLRAPSGGSTDRWNDVTAHLRDKNTLVVIDNTETHLDVTARILGDLHALCPDVGVMTTGREPLHIAGETVYRVGSLPVPNLDDDFASIAGSPAVRLFCDRARAARAGFTLDATTAPAAARICARLDGLPLAMEIAGARVNVLSLDEIGNGLDDRFRLLQSRTRTLPERQRTMQGLLDWSYRLLDPNEQAALRRLAVFGGTFSIAAASEAIASDDLPSDMVPELVWALVDKSLVVADFAHSETRYRLTESVRHYAARLADEADETTEVARGLARWVLEHIGPWLQIDRQWYGLVRVELPNLRVLVDALKESDPETAQQVACSIGRYHAAVNAIEAGLDELGSVVAALPHRTPTRVVLLTALADLHLRHADVDVAVELLNAAAELQAEVGPPAWDDQSVERTRGEVAVRQGDVEAAIAIARQALDGDMSTRGQARMWSLLGVAHYHLGDLAEAAGAFSNELDAYGEIGHDAWIASAHGNLAEVSLDLGNRVAAAHHQQRCLEVASALGMSVMLAYSCIVAARLGGERGDWQLATRLQAGAEAALDAMGQELYAADREAVDRFLDEARSALGEASFEREIQFGETLELSSAAELASEVLSRVEREGSDPIDTDRV